MIFSTISFTFIFIPALTVLILLDSSLLPGHWYFLPFLYSYPEQLLKSSCVLPVWKPLFIFIFFISFLTIPAKNISIRMENPLLGFICHLKWFSCGHQGWRLEKGSSQTKQGEIWRSIYCTSEAAIGEPSSKRFWIKGSLPCLRGSKEAFLSLRIAAQLKGSLLRECFSHTAQLKQS